MKNRWPGVQNMVLILAILNALLFIFVLGLDEKARKSYTEGVISAAISSLLDFWNFYIPE